MKRHSLLTGWVVVLALASAPAALAQSPAAETLQQKVTLPNQVNPPVPVNTTDSDLGEIGAVQRFPKPEMFTASTTQQFFYTDNVFYTNANETESTAYLGTYTASFVPYSLVNWTPRITLQYNMARYGDAASGDFDNENIAFSNQWIFTEDRTWSLTTTVDLSRFTAPHSNGDEFYEEVVYDNQVTHVEQLVKGEPLFFIAGYDLAYHQTNPSNFDRLDNALSFSLAWYPIKTLSIGPYVRPALRIYTTDNAALNQNDRHDFNLSEGIDVTWQPNKWVALSADFSRTDDYSNNSGYSYGNSLPGVSVTGTVKF